MSILSRRGALCATPALGAALVGACGGSVSKGGGSVAGAPAPGVRSGTTISFWHGGTQVDADGRKEIFKSFQDRYPQLKVQQVFNPNDNGAKVQAAITAGTPPDIFYVGNGADVT